jgi:hypothetical protein
MHGGRIEVPQGIQFPHGFHALTATENQQIVGG